MFDNLFSPITINNLKIRNRIAYPGLGLLYSYDGTMNDRYFNFYRERARGGTGIITIGPVAIDFVGSGGIILSLADDKGIPAFQELNRAIKDEGASSWVQLFHAGAYQFPFLLGEEKPIAPSVVYSRYSKATPREMTIEDIKSLQGAYVRAAERAAEAGFDGIEIIASAGYLITQFLSPLKNFREDEYGGSLENRTRFPREVIELVRKKVGDNYPIGIRIAGNDFVPGSNTDMETPEFAKVYEKAGIDIINVTGGWHESRVPQMPMELPRAGFSYLALNIKKAVDVPVIASNRIADPETAEAIIRDGMCDMVNIGRVLIADPEWPNKAKEGRADEIRPCVACSQGCSDQLFGGQPVFCLANPCAGYEGERKIEKASSPKSVMVIGAGPGGLEAAVTASQAGHSVELYEKESDIGGQIWLAGAPPFKREFLELIRYYRAMLKKEGIELFLNTEATIDLIKKKSPDHIIVAEGSEQIIPPIDGIDDPKVLTAWEVLLNDPALGKRVAVIGGGAVGLETALFLAKKGTINSETLDFLFAYEAESVERLKELMFRGSKEITVFEMLPKVGKDVGKSTKWILMGNVEKYGISTIINAKVLSMKNGIVKYEIEGKEDSMEFDNIVIATGSKSLKKISNEIEKTGIPFSSIGDCREPRKINDAIHEGFLNAVSIGT